MNTNTCNTPLKEFSGVVTEAYEGVWGVLG